MEQITGWVSTTEWDRCSEQCVLSYGIVLTRCVTVSGITPAEGRMPVLFNQPQVLIITKVSASRTGMADELVIWAWGMLVYVGLLAIMCSALLHIYVRSRAYRSADSPEHPSSRPSHRHTHRP